MSKQNTITTLAQPAVQLMISELTETQQRIKELQATLKELSTLEKAQAQNLLTKIDAAQYTLEGNKTTKTHSLIGALAVIVSCDNKATIPLEFTTILKQQLLKTLEEKLAFSNVDELCNSLSSDSGLNYENLLKEGLKVDIKLNLAALKAYPQEIVDTFLKELGITFEQKITYTINTGI